MPIYHEADQSNFCTAGYLGYGPISVIGALSTFRMLSVRMSCATIPEAGSCLKFGIFVVKVRRFLWIDCGDGWFIFIFCIVIPSTQLPCSSIIQAHSLNFSTQTIYPPSLLFC